MELLRCHLRSGLWPVSYIAATVKAFMTTVHFSYKLIFPCMYTTSCSLKSSKHIFHCLIPFYLQSNWTNKFQPITGDKNKINVAFCKWYSETQFNIIHVYTVPGFLRSIYQLKLTWYRSAFSKAYMSLVTLAEPIIEQNEEGCITL